MATWCRANSSRYVCEKMKKEPHRSPLFIWEVDFKMWKYRKPQFSCRYDQPSFLPIRKVFFRMCQPAFYGQNPLIRERVGLTTSFICLGLLYRRKRFSPQLFFEQSRAAL